MLGGRSARRSAKISFNNNITYYTWQIWALIVEICNCHVGVFQGVLGHGVLRGLHLTWLYSANWLFTTLIIQKYKYIPTFSWRIQNGCQIHPIIYIPWCIWMVHQPGDLPKWALMINIWNCHSYQLADYGGKVHLPGVVPSPSAKVGSSAKFGVVVFKASILASWGSIGQSRFICQV